MLLKNNGTRPKLVRSGNNRNDTEINIEKIKQYLIGLEKDGTIEGISQNPEAVEVWIRNNLVNLIFRGNPDKEKVSSLRPIHIESYRVRNAKQTRDYNSADQVYLMLGQNPKVKQDLINFLRAGFDKDTNEILESNDLDVDSLGLLQIIRKVTKDFVESQSGLNVVKPLLTAQAEKFCDDIRKLLVYQNSIPRNVLIDYIKTLISFHLALYFQKLVHLLPRIVENSSLNVEDNWCIVVDITDNFDSRIASLAMRDVEYFLNSMYDYIKATFQINSALSYLNLDRNNSSYIDEALNVLKTKGDGFEKFFQIKYQEVHQAKDERGRKHNDEEKQMAEDYKKAIEDNTQYESSFFDKYIQLLVSSDRGNYQYKYSRELFDNICQKNKERGFLAQGRSRKHPRRFVLGSRLLETLIQILVLEATPTGFQSRSLSIEELIGALRDQYGLIINGLNEDRFKDADVNTHLAFKENVEALKQKLRLIGFYNDLSDAYILQKIRPRYPKN